MRLSALVVLLLVSAALLLPPAFAVVDPSGAPGSRGRPAFRPDRILVKPKKGVKLSQMAQLHAAKRSKVSRTFEAIGSLQIVDLSPGSDVMEAVKSYQSSGLVEYAEPDYALRPADVSPNDPMFVDGSLWGLNNVWLDADIDAPEGWGLIHDAGDVVVAVIDTGVRYTHEDLAANMWVNPGEIAGNGIDDDHNGYVDDVHGIDATNNSGNPIDGYGITGHGTHVAGTIGAVGNNGVGVVGVAWRVKLMACKLLDSNYQMYESYAVKCIDYARSKGASITNNSWSSGGVYSSAVRDAIASARSAGIVFVCAANNLSSNTDSAPDYPACYNLDNIVAVAATNSYDYLESYSSYGVNTIDLGAPGGNIASCLNTSDTSYGEKSGTSMATPHVSGVLALLRAMYPGDSYLRLIARLLAGVDPLPALAGKVRTEGRLNLYGALTADPPDLMIWPTGASQFSRAIGRSSLPDQRKYSLTNFGTAALAWTVSHTEDWLSVSPAGGNLTPGQTTVVTVTLAAAADTLGAGAYTDILTFTNTTTGSGDTTRLATFGVWDCPVYVATTGNDLNDGSSWTLAKKTIQPAVDTAGFGQEVWVAQGVYNGKVVLKEGTAVRGGYAGQGDARNPKDYATAIDAQYWGATVEAADYTTIEGFTLRGGDDGVDTKAGHVTISNNVISSSESGAYCLYGYPVITNNTFAGCSYNGIYCLSASAQITNNTITGCMRGVYLHNSQATLTNNIIAFNPGVGIEWSEEGPTPSQSSNCVYGNGVADYYGISPGSTNISADPQFASVTYGNAHIKATSPCRDRGSGVAMPPDARDADWQPRIEGSAVDIGADESYGESYPDPYPARVVYVKQTVPPGGNGASWDTAYSTIQAAVDDVRKNGGAEVWVAGGTYPENLEMVSYALLYGGFTGTELARAERNPRANETTIAAGGYVIDAATASLIDGFTIAGGSVGVHGTYSAPTINNNVVRGNTCGIYCSGYGQTLTNNVITDNATGIGCSAWTDGAITITNNTIVYNTDCGVRVYYMAPGFANNIVAFNTVGVDPRASGSRNDIYGNGSSGAVSGSNISVDPQFIDQIARDFHLAPSSPCRDAGTKTAKGLPDTDMDGQDRIEGPEVDIGADECYGPLQIGVCRVKWDSPVDGPGYDWNHGWRTIASALNSKSSSIQVAAGTYNERVAPGAGVTLKGGYSGVGDERNPMSYPAVLNGGGSGDTITPANGATIDGFTITGGANGVNCYQTSPAITNNIITGNSSNGVFCNNDSATVTNNIIKGNPTGVCAVYSTARVCNNTIVGNTTRGVYCYLGTPVVNNNIVAYNPTGVARYVGASPLSHNDVFGNTTQYAPSTLEHPTDINVDPVFVNSAVGDYHLMLTSPCVDAGDPAGAPDSDFDGNSRPFDGDADGTAVVDIGCFEAAWAFQDVGAVRSLPQDSPVTLGGAVSTAVFGDRFYLQDPNGPFAIGVLGTVSSTGRLVTLQGAVTTVGGERMVDAALIREVSCSEVPAPLFLSSNALGGGPCGAQAPVEDWRMMKVGETWQRAAEPAACGGANNIGLLVKVVGRVTTTNEGFFYIDDGSPFDDGDPLVRGVRVDWPYASPMPETGTFMELTAISSCWLKTVGEESVLVRLLRPVAGDAWRAME